MSNHKTDRFSVSSLQNASYGSFDFFLTRKSQEDPMVTVDTFSLTSNEAEIFFCSLLDMPEFQKIATEKLVALNLVRESHL